jgi:hypothetical protein
MEARLVWDTWRRILTNDQLVDLVLHPKSSGESEASGLTAEELAILNDYASTPVPTETNIGMYRRGLVRNALGALNLVPLTNNLLYLSGLDVDEIAENYVRSVGYADDGPNFWKTAAGFVDYLTTLPEFASQVWKDVMALDAATIALARRLGTSTVDVWPEDAAINLSETDSLVDHESTRFVASHAAVVVSSSHDLTGWIENPYDFDVDEELEASARLWLIYFPKAEAEHAYAELSPRSARAFNFLSTPKTVTEVSLALDGLPGAEVIEVIDSLAQLGVVLIQGRS